MSATREVLLGYHAWIESPASEMSVAGFLVTNHRGIPIEFRYTDPVEMTETQRMLYGETSHEEALAVTMAASLWKSVQQKPGILLVEDFSAARLWEHLAGRQETRVAHLHTAPGGVFLPELPGRVVLPVEADGERIAALQSLPAAPAGLAALEGVLTEASRTMRLDEPFERVEAILQGIHNLKADERRRRSAAADPEPHSRNGSTVVPTRPATPVASHESGGGGLGSESRVAARLNQINAANRRMQVTPQPSTPTSAPQDGPATDADAAAAGAGAEAASGTVTRRPDLQWMYRSRGE